MPSNPSNTAPVAPAEKRKGCAILPPNDPTRKDWGILSDSLGLKTHAVPKEGSTPEAAAHQMKALLLDIVKSDKAYEALIMKCAAASISGKLREDVSARVSYDDMMSFLKSRLWNRRGDGAKTTSRKGREHSSNDIIQSWDPIAGGIGKYLQTNVSNILNRDWKQATMAISNPNKVSLEALAAKGRHLDQSGRIFDSSNSDASADQTEYVENDEAFDKDSSRFHADQKPADAVEDIDQEQEEPTPEDLAAEEKSPEDTMTEQRRQFETALKPSVHTKNNSAILRTTEHPDFQALAAALVSDVPEPELDGDGRATQLRDMARRAISMHFEETEEQGEMLDAVDSWNPAEVTFARYFPEACEQFSRSLDVVGEKHAFKDDLQLEFAIDFIAVSDELSRQSKNIKPRPAGMSAIEWEEVRDSVNSWFGEVCQGTEDLASPSRPDYLALNALTGRKPDMNIQPDELASSLKGLYSEWVSGALSSAKTLGENSFQVLSDNHEAITEMNRRMESWDPLTEGYAGEAMVTYLHEIRHEQKLRDEERRRHQAEALSQEHARNAAMLEIKAKPVRIPAVEQTMMFAETDWAVPAVANKLPTPNPKSVEPSR